MNRFASADLVDFAGAGIGDWGLSLLTGVARLAGSDVIGFAGIVICFVECVFCSACRH